MCLEDFLLTGKRLGDVHPEVFFGDDWLEFAGMIKKAETPAEFAQVFIDISKKFQIVPGDVVVVFARILFSEEQFYDFLSARDAYMMRYVFETMGKSE